MDGLVLLDKFLEDFLALRFLALANSLVADAMLFCASFHVGGGLAFLIHAYQPWHVLGLVVRQLDHTLAVLLEDAWLWFVEANNTSGVFDESALFEDEWRELHVDVIAEGLVQLWKIILSEVLAARSFIAEVQLKTWCGCTGGGDQTQQKCGVHGSPR